MYALIERAAARAPGSVAVVADDRSQTYGELLGTARRIAPALRATGRTRVGVVEPDAARVLALLAAGALVGVELCLYPPVAGPGEVAELADRLDHDLLITDRTDVDRLTTRFADLAAGPEEPAAAPSSAQPVLVLTTGTTGTPRGVRHDWRRLTARALGAAPAAGQRWLLAYGVHQFAGYQVLIHVASIGATLVDPGTRRPRPGLDAMRRHGVTHASATPTFWRFLLAELRSDGGPVPALEQITLGGEAVPASVLAELVTVFPGARTSQVYAASEFGPTGAVSDGRPGLPVEVLGADAGADVAVAVVDGELWVRSRGGMLGYHGEEPVDDPDGWRPTGDLVEIVGDRILFRGRAAEIINVGGVKVHPLPIEERVSAVPGVAVARVFGRPNPLTGAIVAVEIVPVEGADLRRVRDEIVTVCADLPDASRPRSVRFVDAVATRGQKILRSSRG